MLHPETAPAALGRGAPPTRWTRSRTLLKPGEAAPVNKPGGALEFARLSRQGRRLLPVPQGPDGPDLAVMAQLLAEQRQMRYVTVSVLHNPTGQTLSLAAAHQRLKLAEQLDLTVVEDDVYAWLAPAHAPRLAGLDGLDGLARTVYVSGFSRILAPNWRAGFVAAAPALAPRLIDPARAGHAAPPALQERAVAWWLDQGLLRRHADCGVQRPRPRQGDRLENLSRQIERACPASVARRFVTANGQPDHHSIATLRCC